MASNVLGSHFDSINDAEWYNNCGRMIGFRVRKDDLQHEKKYDQVTTRQWVCHFKGLKEEKYSQNYSRVPEPQLITRTGCRA